MTHHEVLCAVAAAAIYMSAAGNTYARDQESARSVGSWIEDHKNRETRDVADIFASGIYSGYIYANVFNSHKGLPKIFCQPDKLLLNGYQVADILIRFINKDSKNHNIMEFDVAMILGFAFMDAFPCKDDP
jgi:hypothetical protein